MASDLQQTSDSTANNNNSLSQLTGVEDLVKKTKQLENMRRPLEKQWKLNLAFYRGKQYSYFPPRSDRLESLAVDEGSKPRHRVRIVSNQIMPGAHTLLAQLTKTKPHIYATPGSGAESEVRAAQMAESLLEYWWQDFALDEKLDEALLWSLIAGSGYWKITWDPFAAKQMRFTLDPTGQPITNDALKTEFLGQLQKMDIQPQEKIVYMGDINIDVMSPFDVFLDPGAKTFEDCKFAICRHNLDVDEVKARWKKDVKPDASPAQPDETLPYSTNNDSRNLSLRKVYIMYVKPHAAMPNGRYVVWVEGNDKQILADTKWPYPFNDLPLVKFPGLRIPGAVYDDSFVTHAIPLQKELNRTVSQIVEYKNLTINPVMISPVGSLRTRRTTEPGQVLEYAPVGQGLKPEFEQLPTLPPYVFQHLADISSRLQEIFLSPEVIQGKVPPNVEAGVAIDLLQEMATDKLAPIIKLLENSLARAGQQMLSLAQQYYIEPRLIKIRGSGGTTQVKQFENADINGNITFHTETGSGLPRTRAGRQARIESLVQLGIVPPNKAIRYFDLSDLRGLEATFQADEELAYRNIDKIINKQPVNPTAVQNAMMAVQHGIDPKTQQKITSPQQAQEVLHDASLSSPTGIDFDVHLDITGTFMKGVEYETLDLSIQQDFITYWGNLLQTKLSLPAATQPMPAHVTYQIRGTTGPTAASKILERAGVMVTPDDMSEPPLETWITDSIDKPDTDAAGPGEEANQLSQAANIVLEGHIADAQSKQAAAHKQVEHVGNVANTVQQQQQADEIHNQKLNQEQLKTALAAKKLQQSDFKPKPKPKGK